MTLAVAAPRASPAMGRIQRASRRASTAVRAELGVFVGTSPSWKAVAQDVKARLAPVVESQQARMEQLMVWLGETRIEAPAAEVVVRQLPIWESDNWRAEYQLVANQLLSEWLSAKQPSRDVEAQMAAVLAQRILQAYEENTGEALNAGDEAALGRLPGFLPAVLGEVMDGASLQSVLTTFAALPSETPVPRPPPPPRPVAKPAVPSAADVLAALAPREAGSPASPADVLMALMPPPAGAAPPPAVLAAPTAAAAATATPAQAAAATPAAAPVASASPQPAMAARAQPAKAAEVPVGSPVLA